MQIYLIAGNPSLAICLSLLACGLGLYIWAMHPGNLTLINFKIKAELKFHKERELAWRNFRANPARRAVGKKERLVLSMTEFEFEEWLVSLWASSKFWYQRRLNAFHEWHYSRQFEILKNNPSPTDGEMDNVIYLTQVKSRA